MSKLLSVLMNNNGGGLSNVLDYNNTPFLCHFDGNTDNLGCGGSIQRLGTSSYTSTPSKFGTYSLRAISWADLSGFAYEPTDKYTVECWAYNPDTSANLICWTRGGDDTNGYLWVAMDSGNSAITIRTTTTVSVPVDKTIFHHIAFTYDGNQNFNIFIDGELKHNGTAHTVVSNAGHYSPDVNTIHGNNTHISEYVIHKGIRYTENFTPLNVPYVIQ